MLNKKARVTTSTGTFSHPYGTFGTIVDYEVSFREFSGSYIDPNTGNLVTMTVNIFSYAVEIIASDCILDRVCGLCGTSDGDSSNDIHVRINDTDSFLILGTSITERHVFGDSWCKEDISQIFGNDIHVRINDTDSFYILTKNRVNNHIFGDS